MTVQEQRAAILQELAEFKAFAEGDKYNIHNSCWLYQLQDSLEKILADNSGKKAKEVIRRLDAQGYIRVYNNGWCGGKFKVLKTK